MLQVSVHAVIEAPIRLQLTEEADCSTSIRCWLPSAVLARCPSEELMALGRELDPIFAALVADSAGPG